MKYAVAKLLNLVGYGLQIDFGELTVISWKNAKGKTCEIFRGDYMLQIFDCFWRIRRKNDIILACNDVENDIDFLDLLHLSDKLYLRNSYEVNNLDFTLSFTQDIEIDFFSIITQPHPLYLLTDKYNKTFSDLNVLYNDIK